MSEQHNLNGDMSNIGKRATQKFTEDRGETVVLEAGSLVQDREKTKEGELTNVLLEASKCEKENRVIVSPSKEDNKSIEEKDSSYKKSEETETTSQELQQRGNTQAVLEASNDSLSDGSIHIVVSEPFSLTEELESYISKHNNNDDISKDSVDLKNTPENVIVETDKNKQKDNISENKDSNTFTGHGYIEKTSNTLTHEELINRTLEKLMKKNISGSQTEVCSKSEKLTPNNKKCKSQANLKTSDDSNSVAIRSPKELINRTLEILCRKKSQEEENPDTGEKLSDTKEKTITNNNHAGNTTMSNAEKSRREEMEKKLINRTLEILCRKKSQVDENPDTGGKLSDTKQKTITNNNHADNITMSNEEKSRREEMEKKLVNRTLEILCRKKSQVEENPDTGGKLSDTKQKTITNNNHAGNITMSNEEKSRREEMEKKLVNRTLEKLICRPKPSVSKEITSNEEEKSGEVTCIEKLEGNEDSKKKCVQPRTLMPRKSKSRASMIFPRLHRTAKRLPSEMNEKCVQPRTLMPRKSKSRASMIFPHLHRTVKRLPSEMKGKEKLHKGIPITNHNCIVENEREKPENETCKFKLKNFENVSTTPKTLNFTDSDLKHDLMAPQESTLNNKNTSEIKASDKRSNDNKRKFNIDAGVLEDRKLSSSNRAISKINVKTLSPKFDELTPTKKNKKQEEEKCMNLSSTDQLKLTLSKKNNKHKKEEKCIDFSSTDKVKLTPPKTNKKQQERKCINSSSTDRDGEQTKSNPIKSKKHQEEKCINSSSIVRDKDQIKPNPIVCLVDCIKRGFPEKYERLSEVTFVRKNDNASNLEVQRSNKIENNSANIDSEKCFTQLSPTKKNVAVKNAFQANEIIIIDDDDDLPLNEIQTKIQQTNSGNNLIGSNLSVIDESDDLPLSVLIDESDDLPLSVLCLNSTNNMSGSKQCIVSTKKNPELCKSIPPLDSPKSTKKVTVQNSSTEITQSTQMSQTVCINVNNEPKVTQCFASSSKDSESTKNQTSKTSSKNLFFNEIHQGFIPVNQSLQSRTIRVFPSFALDHTYNKKDNQVQYMSNNQPSSVREAQNILIPTSKQQVSNIIPNKLSKDLCARNVKVNEHLPRRNVPESNQTTSCKTNHSLNKIVDTSLPNNLLLLNTGILPIESAAPQTQGTWNNASFTSNQIILDSPLALPPNTSILNTFPQLQIIPQQTVPVASNSQNYYLSPLYVLDNEKVVAINSSNALKYAIGKNLSDVFQRSLDPTITQNSLPQCFAAISVTSPKVNLITTDQSSTKKTPEPETTFKNKERNSNTIMSQERKIHSAHSSCTQSNTGTSLTAPVKSKHYIQIPQHQMLIDNTKINPVVDLNQVIVATTSSTSSNTYLNPAYQSSNFYPKVKCIPQHSAVSLTQSGKNGPKLTLENKEQNSNIIASQIGDKHQNSAHSKLNTAISLTSQKYMKKSAPQVNISPSIEPGCTNGLETTIKPKHLLKSEEELNRKRHHEVYVLPTCESMKSSVAKKRKYGEHVNTSLILSEDPKSGNIDVSGDENALGKEISKSILGKQSSSQENHNSCLKRKDEDHCSLSSNKKKIKGIGSDGMVNIDEQLVCSKQKNERDTSADENLLNKNKLVKTSEKCSRTMDYNKSVTGTQDGRVISLPRDVNSKADFCKCQPKVKKRVKNREEELDDCLDGVPPFIKEVFECENICYGFDTKDLIFVLSLLPDIEEMTSTQKVIFQSKAIQIIKDIFINTKL